MFLSNVSTGCSSERFNQLFLAPLGTLGKIYQPWLLVEAGGEERK